MAHHHKNMAKYKHLELYLFLLIYIIKIKLIFLCLLYKIFNTIKYNGKQHQRNAKQWPK